MLKDALPKLARVGLLTLTGTSIATDLQLKELRAAALALKLKLEEIDTQADPKSNHHTARSKRCGFSCW